MSFIFYDPYSRAELAPAARGRAESFSHVGMIGWFARQPIRAGQEVVWGCHREAISELIPLNNTRPR